MYQKAFHWVHAAYADGPGRTLTAVQVARACGVDATVCGDVLEDLVRGRILTRTEDVSRLAQREAAHPDSGLPSRQRHAPA